MCGNVKYFLHPVQKKTRSPLDGRVLKAQHMRLWSGVLHYDLLHHVRHMLTGVSAFLKVEIDLPPADDLHRVGAGGVQLPHAGHKDLIRLLLQGVDGDDVVPQALGVAEGGELFQHELDHVAALHHDGDQLQGVGPDALDVVVVEPDQRLQVKEVDVYKQLSKECYIRSGLSEGDRVLNNNVLLVYNALNAD